MPAEFVITKIVRDREWFAAALPTLKNVYDEIQAARENARATGAMPYPPRQITRRKGVKRAIECDIVDDLYGSPPKIHRPSSAVCLFSEAYDSGSPKAVNHEQKIVKRCMFSEAFDYEKKAASNQEVTRKCMF